MKTRLDFVSNSSSASFIVNDVLKFATKLIELIDNDIFWAYGLLISFMFKSTEENKKAFSKFIDEYSYCSLDNMINAYGKFENFFSINPAFYDLMKDVSIYAYDDNDQNDIIKLSFLLWQ